VLEGCWDVVWRGGKWIGRSIENSRIVSSREIAGNVVVEEQWVPERIAGGYQGAEWRVVQCSTWGF
jgi:hypothetical protein